MQYPSATEMLKLIARLSFRPFTQGDWYAFSGCETPDPLIAEVDTAGFAGTSYTIVILARFLATVENNCACGHAQPLCFC